MKMAEFNSAKVSVYNKYLPVYLYMRIYLPVYLYMRIYLPVYLCIYCIYQCTYYVYLHVHSGVFVASNYIWMICWFLVCEHIRQLKTRFLLVTSRRISQILFQPVIITMTDMFYYYDDDY